MSFLFVMSIVEGKTALQAREEVNEENRIFKEFLKLKINSIISGLQEIPQYLHSGFCECRYHFSISKHKF